MWKRKRKRRIHIKVPGLTGSQLSQWFPPLKMANICGLGFTFLNNHLIHFHQDVKMWKSWKTSIISDQISLSANVMFVKSENRLAG